MNVFEPIIKDSLTKAQMEQVQLKQHELILLKQEPVVPGHTLFS